MEIPGNPIREGNNDDNALTFTLLIRLAYPIVPINAVRTERVSHMCYI